MMINADDDAGKGLDADDLVRQSVLIEQRANKPEIKSPSCNPLHFSKKKEDMLNIVIATPRHAV